MAKTKVSLYKEFTKGIVKENPVLRLLLGCCPTLAVTTSVKNGLGMGAAVIFVLIGSNLVVSLLRKVIPEKVRIPSFIIIIAGFVTLVQLLLQTYLPELNDSLGIFIPLITVNCIILARAEMFASKNPVLPSLVDGLGMGIGSLAALVLMGSIREVIGNGTFMNMSIPFIQAGGSIEPMLIMILPPGGFFAFGILIALAQKLSEKFEKKNEIEGDVCVGAISERTACLLCGGCSFGRNGPQDPQQEAEAMKRMAMLSLQNENQDEESVENNGGAQT